MKRRPSVLHSRVVTGTGGGPEKTILNSARFLEPYGYDVVVAYMHPPGDPGFEDLRSKAARWRSPLVGIPDRGPFDSSVIHAHLELCRRHRIAIWHGHDYKSNILGLLLRPFHRMHLVTTAHGWGVKGKRTELYYSLEKAALHGYEKVVCVSDTLMQLCREAGIAERKLRLIENAIDVDEFRRTRLPHEARTEDFARPPGRFVIGAMGRLSREKGFDLLIRSVDELVEQGRDLELWIVGEGSERSNLEKVIAHCRHPGRMKLWGFRSDNLEMLERFDAFTLSSTSEGLPNVILEALALEVPIVATRVGAVPKMLSDGVTGLLCPPGDAMMLQARLAELIGSPGLCSSLSSAGRKTAVEHYSFKARMEKMRALYREVLHISKPAHGGRPPA